MKRLYPSVQEIVSNYDIDFMKSLPFDWRFGLGLPALYVEYSALWDTLYYNGFISRDDYPNNPFPL